MSEKKCLPCPFCGGTEMETGHGTEDREGWPIYVYCDDCGAHGPWTYTRDKGLLVELVCEVTGWNKRV